MRTLAMYSLVSGSVGKLMITSCETPRSKGLSQVVTASMGMYPSAASGSYHSHTPSSGGPAKKGPDEPSPWSTRYLWKKDRIAIRSR